MKKFILPFLPVVAILVGIVAAFGKRNHRERNMNAKQVFVATVFMCLAALNAACAVECSQWPGLEDILLDFAEPGNCSQWPSLDEYAEAQGKTPGELEASLMEIVQSEILKSPNVPTSALAKNAIWGLAEIGEERERAFVRQIMETNEGYYRHVAMCAWFRLSIGKWEECVREIAADGQFDEHDRYLAYRETFQIGMNGDVATRNRVVEVLSEMQSCDSCMANRNRLGLWLVELGKGDWEEWCKKVMSEDGFTNADRYRAGELAFRTGMEGDANTRRRAIDVLKLMKGRDQFQANMSHLERWISELEAK